MIRHIDFQAHLEEPEVYLKCSQVSRACVQMSDLTPPMTVGA